MAHGITGALSDVADSLMAMTSGVVSLRQEAAALTAAVREHTAAVTANSAVLDRVARVLEPEEPVGRLVIDVGPITEQT